MNPLYFGDSSRQLFGLYQPPKGRKAVDHGVVFCYPMGQEYMRAHRAFRQMAMMLCRQGLHVFRFDTFGTGDSEGDFEQADLGQWIEDVGTAIDELEDTAGIGRVSLVGLRLGGSLAVLGSEGRKDVDRVILWDPIVSGEAYVRELTKAAEDELVAGSLLGGQLSREAAAKRIAEDDPIGVNGFGLTASLRAEIEAVDLRQLDAFGFGRADVLVSSETEEHRQLVDHLTKAEVEVDFEHIAVEGRWDEVDNFGSALLPHGIIHAIVNRLTA